MNFLKYAIFSLSILLLFTKCGEDRTHEYLELTEENQWIYSKMKENYFWSDSIIEPEERDFFGKPQNFFSSLLYRYDNASFFTDTVVETSYGMSFVIMRDPLETERSRSYALILLVEPGSAAEKAGVKRGTWIYKAGSKTISASNYGHLEKGDATTLYTRTIELNEESAEYSWTEGDTLEIEPATPLQPTAIYMDTVYDVRDKKIGYLVLNSFHDERIVEEMQTVCARFSSERVNELIIDLRYNTGGYLHSAAEIAGAFVPADKAGTPFCKLKYNNNSSKETDEYLFGNSATNITTDNIYIFTTQQTKGAAEAFITALKSAIGNENVVIMGETTAGDNLYVEKMESPFGFAINPTVAQVLSPDGTMLPASGIFCDYNVNELSQYYTIFPLGEQQEYMLYNAIYFITNGQLPYSNYSAKINVTRKHLPNKGKSIIR